MGELKQNRRSELCNYLGTRPVKLYIGGRGGTVDRPSPRGRESDRVDIQDCPRWQISPDGTIYYNRKKVTPEGNEPKIDLGLSARPPVIPAFGDGSRERFVDELVCWHFHKRLPLAQQLHTSTFHLDGNWSNCAADNVQWNIDEDWIYQRTMRLWMKSDIPSKRIKNPGAARFGRDYREPIETLPKWSNAHPTWVHDRNATP